MVDSINASNKFTDDDRSSIFDGAEPGLHFGFEHFSWSYVFILFLVGLIASSCFGFAHLFLVILFRGILGIFTLWKLQIFGVLSVGTVQSSRTTLDDSGNPILYHVTVQMCMHQPAIWEQNNTNSSMPMNPISQSEGNEVNRIVVEVTVSSTVYEEALDTCQLRMIFNPSAPREAIPEDSVTSCLSTYCLIFCTFIAAVFATWSISVPLAWFLLYAAAGSAVGHLFTLTVQLTHLYVLLCLCCCLFNAIIRVSCFGYSLTLRAICDNDQQNDENHHETSHGECIELTTILAQPAFRITLPTSGHENNGLSSPGGQEC